MARLTSGALTFNTLYIVIYRLQEREFIREAEKRIAENRTRVYFAITEKGQAHLQELIAEYTAATRASGPTVSVSGSFDSGSKHCAVDMTLTCSPGGALS